MKLSIVTGEYERLGRQIAEIMWMYDEETPEHQQAIQTYLKYEAQVLNPKSEIQFECAKAFITAGGRFIKEIKNSEEPLETK